MSIKYKGVVNNYNDIVETVPAGAVKYIDNEALKKEGVNLAIYNIVAMIVPAVIFSIKYLELKETPFVFSLLGIIIGCILLFPHEILHGVCFPKKDHVFIYQMLKPPGMFVGSNTLISKRRFIFMNLLPAIVFGLIPLIIWLFVSPYTLFAKVLFSVGFINVITCGNDYMNVIKTVRSVPMSAKIQTTGVRVYYI